MSKTVTETSTESNSVELKRGSKGGYSWTVKIYGEDSDKIIRQLDYTNEKLDMKYGGKEHGNSSAKPKD